MTAFTTWSPATSFGMEFEAGHNTWSKWLADEQLFWIDPEAAVKDYGTHKLDDCTTHALALGSRTKITGF
jgi:hypothetical protein